jgi:hypothetical protein
MKDNVIDFVGIRNKKIKESQKPVISSYSIDIDDLCEEITADVLVYLNEEGFLDIEDEAVESAYSIDIAFLYESMKSLIYKTDNMYHPLQYVAYSVFDLYEENEKAQMSFDFPEQNDDPQISFDFTEIVDIQD